MSSNRPENGSRVRTWDYEFEWTADHFTADDLRPLIYSYDELATRCLDQLDALRPPRKPRGAGDGSPGPDKADADTTDLYLLLKQHAAENETLGELWAEVNTVPDWVDWAQIERGQHVFYRYAGPSIVGMSFQALLGGMGSARVVETLTRTGGFGVHVARRRLLESLQHVLDVTHSVAALRPGGDGRGFASSIRVRLLHASVRRRILALAAARPAYYSTAANGVPINDLDSIGTILAFSATLLWLSFPRQGIWLREREQRDYLALWRYVAHLLGVPTHPFASLRAARAWMESLMVSEIAPSDTSRTLGANMIAALANRPPGYPSAAFLRAEAYWLNGPALCTALGIPRPEWYHTLLVGGQCLFFMALVYARRDVAAWDRAGIARARRVLHALTTAEANGGSAPAHPDAQPTHAFRYVPSLEMTATPRAESDAVSGEKSGVGVGVNGDGVERRNLVAVVVASVVLGGVAWAGMRGASGLLQVLW